MLNWRKYLIFFLFYCSGSKVLKILNTIKKLEYLSLDKLEEYQKDKLKKLLIYSFQNVPYYAMILKEKKVVDDNLNVNLNNYKKIPVLTKDIIRREGNLLYSKDAKKRKSFQNTSGGSTGEPVKFIQDKEYYEWNVVTNKLYFNLIHGKKLGEKEINLWGSERDILRNSLSIKEKIINYLYNRTFLNTFKLDESRIKKYIDQINKIKPVCIWAYVESLDLISKYIIENNIKINPPQFIISTAGTLYEDIRKNVEKAFNCHVYNQYGSREVGPLAVECNNKKGLHYFPWSHYIEIIDQKIYVTVLTNYSMPLIRYEIGDTGVKSNKKDCSCGRNTLIFKNITGRVISHFKNKNGDIVHGQYFIHLFYFRKNVKKFQIVQEDYNKIECRVVGNLSEIEKKDITLKIKKVMGNSFKVIFKFVKNIETTKSGKYLYTVCKILNKKIIK